LKYWRHSYVSFFWGPRPSTCVPSWEERAGLCDIYWSIFSLKGILSFYLSKLSTTLLSNFRCTRRHLSSSHPSSLTAHAARFTSHAEIFTCCLQELKGAASCVFASHGSTCVWKLQSTYHELVPAKNASLEAMQGSASGSNVRYYPTSKHSPLKERNKAVTMLKMPDVCS
jgi:hypothetical protein